MNQWRAGTESDWLAYRAMLTHQAEQELAEQWQQETAEDCLEALMITEEDVDLD